MGGGREEKEKREKRKKEKRISTERTLNEYCAAKRKKGKRGNPGERGGI